MRRVGQMLLLPLWAVGFIVGVVVVTVLAVWRAARAGYVDATTWVGN